MRKSTVCADLKTITFILPGGGGLPVGGYKTVYEYANGLAARGWRVRVAHSCMATREEMEAARNSPLIGARRWVGYHRRRLTGSFRPDGWFRVNPRVELFCTRNPEPRHIPASDVVVATAWVTGEWVAEYPPEKGAKVFFIQDHEIYMTSPKSEQDRIRRIFCDGRFVKVGISPAVRTMIEGFGSHIDAEIANGLDHGIYRVHCPVESVFRDSIGFPVRDEWFKGTQDAIRALEIVRERRPGVKVWAFGRRQNTRVPSWVRFHLLPSDGELSALYNRTSVFVVASHYEGWGLPGSEAMACGAALVSTDSGGVRAYAEHGRTALLSDPKDSDTLAINILRLLDDSALRIGLAREGQAHIQRFTWDRAVDAFEVVSKRALERKIPPSTVSHRVQP